MSESSKPQRGAWWGWGAGQEVAPLSEEVRSLLSGRFGGTPTTPAPAVQPSQVDLPEVRPVPDGMPSELDALLDRSDSERLRHSVGMSYPDLIRLRSGQLDHAPDAVGFPRSVEQVEGLVTECARLGVAVVPFGGGTSVVGGVKPERGTHRAVMTVDLSGLRDVQIDARSGISRLGPGLRGPEAEYELGRRGFTLGHFPQSFERASIGGFAATRSAGQASSGYGRFDDLVTSIVMASPKGTLRTIDTPHSAAGPSLRELVVGSEGTLGVITTVGCKIRPAPEAERYEGWMTEDFAAGCEAVRHLAQSGSLPDVIRVSDGRETEVGLAMSSAAPRVTRFLERYLDLRGKGNGSLVICGWQGSRDTVARRRRRARRGLRAGGAVSLGAAPGRSWERSRYGGPYLRDHLIDSGVLVETLETAHTWSRLGDLYQRVGDSLRSNLGNSAIVMCHLSHAYEDGASLYFTFLAPVRPGDEIETWTRVKTAACDAIVSCGGTITHHHAVGRDHARWMHPEIGQVGLDALTGAKERLDPTGIMNPGALLPAAS
ncbi:MAG: FAD-binding oxidoreductase [bacterium]